MIDHSRSLSPAHLLRRMQLLLFQWFDTTRRAGTPRDVDFAQIIVDISVGTFLPPQMPPTFFTLTSKLAPLEAPSPLLPAPAPVPRITPKPEPVPQPSPPGVGSIVINPAGADATLFARLEGKQIREVIRNEVMPVNAANVPMCLTYHARGQCYSNCRLVADHKRHSDAEQRTLVALAEQAVRNYEARRATTPTPAASGAAALAAPAVGPTPP